jgi:hypothetical protein
MMINLAKTKFERETGGMRPNAKATYQDFVNQLRQSARQDAKALSAVERTVLFVRHAGLPGEQVIRNADIPLGMSQSAYRQHFARLFATVRAESVPTLAGIDRFSQIVKATSAMFLPMIAMLLSLVSIIINVSQVAWMSIMGVAARLQRISTCCSWSCSVLQYSSAHRAGHLPRTRPSAAASRPCKPPTAGLARQFRASRPFRSWCMPTPDCWPDQWQPILRLYHERNGRHTMAAL